MMIHRVPKILAGGIAVLTLTACGLAVASASADGLADKVQGTWQRNLDEHPGFRAVKTISGRRFMLAIYEVKTGTAVMVAGGTCSVDGTKYTEILEFGSPAPGPLEMVGHDQVFDATVKGDVWVLNGELSNGVKINETWNRLKEPEQEGAPSASSGGGSVRHCEYSPRRKLLGRLRCGRRCR